MGNENTTKSWLDPPDLKGVKNADGTYTLSGTDLQAQRDFNYYVAKMLQGGLNLANLNKETNEVFTGKVSFIDLSDPTKSTVIDGSHITTGTVSADRVSGGTLEGVTLLSQGKSGALYTGNDVKIENGTIYVTGNSGETNAGLSSTISEFKIWSTSPMNSPIIIQNANGRVETVAYTIKIDASGNLSIDAGGTIYIGTSNVGETIEIGSATATINLNGAAINKNGVPL